MHGADVGVGNGETQPHASHAGDVVESLKGSKHHHLLVFGDAGTLVGDAAPHAAVDQTAGDHHLASPAAVLDCVGQQVGEHLNEMATVGEDRVVAQAGDHMHMVFPGRAGHERDRLGEGIGEVNADERRFEHVGLSARIVQQILHESGDVAACSENVAGHFAVGLVRQSAVEELCEARDGVERCAQLVAHP